MKNLIAYGIVYKITNLVTGAAYIGVTRKTLARRMRNHRAAVDRFDHILYRAVRKYGWENFEVTVIAVAHCKAELNSLERDLIATHGTHASAGGYNMTGGGEGTPDICDQTRKNMRQAASKRLTPEVRAKISATLKGRPLPPHVRAARIASQTGVPAHNKGKTYSAEVRARVSAGLKLSYERRRKAAEHV